MSVRDDSEFRDPEAPLFSLRLQPSFARQPLGFQAFAIFLKFRTGLAVRDLLLRRVWVEGLSIGLVRDLFLSRSFLCAHFFAFSPRSTSRLWAPHPERETGLILSLIHI